MYISYVQYAMYNITMGPLLGKITDENMPYIYIYIYHTYMYIYIQRDMATCVATRCHTHRLRQVGTAGAC